MRASEVIVANCGATGAPALHLGPHVNMDDGVLDVCIVRARTGLNLLQIAWSVLLGRQQRQPNLRFLRATLPEGQGAILCYRTMHWGMSAFGTAF